jgi:hypothetical protein
MKTGSCVCGGVTYKIAGEIQKTIACHCTQCRKLSGHYWSATQVPVENLTITRIDGLKWFQSSENAKRGFCKECGSSLFWEWTGNDTICIGTGTLDGVTGLTTDMHIFVGDKGDYYEIADEIPQHEQYY